MATETILSVSLKEYKKQIQDLAATLASLEKGSKSYEKVAKDLKDKQDRLNDALNLSKKKSDDLEGSYNHLSKQMAELKKQWKATNDEAERQSIGKQINDINNKLKGMDASIGNFQRNVGNYGSAWTNILGQISPKLTGFISQISTMSTSITQLGGAMTATGAEGVAAMGGLEGAVGALASPIGAIVAAFIAMGIAITKVCTDIYDALDSDAEIQEQWADVVARFQPFGVLYDRTIQSITAKLVNLADALTKNMDAVVGWGNAILQVCADALQPAIGLATKFLSLMGMITYEMNKDELKKIGETTADIAKLETQLFEDRKRIITENAELYNKEQEAREKALNSEKYNAQQRKKFAEEAKKLSQQQIDNNIKLAELEKQIAIKTNHNLSGTNREDALKEAEATAKVNRLEGEKNRNLADYEKLIRRVGKTQGTVNTSNIKGLNQQIQKTKELTDLEKQRASAGQLSTLSTAQIDIYKDDLTKAKNKWNLADAQSADGLNIEQRREKAKELHEINQEILQEQIQNQKDLMDVYAGNEGSREYRAAQTALAELNRQLLTMTNDYEIEKLKIEKDAADEKIKLDEETARKEKEQLAKRQKNIDMWTSATSGLLSSVSDAWMAGVDAQVKAGKMSEEEAEKRFEESKKLQYATALIDMFSGAVGIYFSTLKDNTIQPSWVRTALAATQYASALATGYSQIANIANATYSSASSGASSGGGGMSMAAVQPILSQELDTAQLTAINTDRTANNTSTDTRVYILQNDIQKSNQQVAVRENDTTF